MVSPCLRMFRGVAPDSLLYRMMRRTGKLYKLTLISVSFGIVASVSVSRWNFNTSEFHLWLDLVPQGFGIASTITTTLIVSPSCFPVIPVGLSFLTLWRDRRL